MIMEDKNDGKRARDDSPAGSVGSPEPKRFQAGPEPGIEPAGSELCSPEAKRIQDDLLNMLDDSEAVAEDRDPAIQGLDSVIRSFEEEILVPQVHSVLDLGLEADETRSELGYLLEASDDELGLPPSFGSSAEDDGKVAADGELPAPATSPEGFGFGETMTFENEMTGYDSFEFVPESGHSDNHEPGDEFVMLGGLFDFPEGSCEPDEGPEMLWRPESLPAI